MAFLYCMVSTIISMYFVNVYFRKEKKLGRTVDNGAKIACDISTNGRYTDRNNWKKLYKVI